MARRYEMMHRRVGNAVRVLALVSLIALVPGVAEAQRITGKHSEPSTVVRVDRPVVYPDSAQNRETLEDAILQAALHTNRVNPDIYVTVPWAPEGWAEGGAAATSGFAERYRLTVNAVREAGPIRSL